MFLSESGNRRCIISARRMISRLILNHLNGWVLVMAEPYWAPAPSRAEFFRQSRGGNSTAAPDYPDLTRPTRIRTRLRAGSAGSNQLKVPQRGDGKPEQHERLEHHEDKMPAAHDRKRIERGLDAECGDGRHEAYA